MDEVFTAFGRALKSLTQPVIFWHLLWPAQLAFVLWLVIAWLFWGELTAVLMQQFDAMPWLEDFLGRWGMVALTTALFIKLLLWFLLLPLIYATTLMIVAIIALPLMLERVAVTDYADLEQRRGGNFAGTVWNALVALLFYSIGWIVTLPLWLIPGVGLILSLFWLAYLNQRAYRYDALALHADSAEREGIIAREKGGLYLLGFGAGVLGFVPLANFLAPAFVGLAYVHFCLEKLRRLRRAEAREV